MRCSSIPVRRFLVASSLGLLLLALGGCRGDSLPFQGPTGTVKGKVTCNGNPVPAGCDIVFMHQQKSLPATATTGADGSYSLQMGGKPGILAGAYKVSLTPPAKEAAAAPDPSNPEAYKAFMTGKAPKAAEEKPPFPKKYQVAETSGLTYTVEEGENTIDIELKNGP